MNIQKYIPIPMLRGDIKSRFSTVDNSLSNSPLSIVSSLFMQTL